MKVSFLIIQYYCTLLIFETQTISTPIHTTTTNTELSTHKPMEGLVYVWSASTNEQTTQGWYPVETCALRTKLVMQQRIAEMGLHTQEGVRQPQRINYGDEGMNYDDEGQ